MHGFSQEYLGDRLGKSQQYVSQIETGELTPDAESVQKIAAILEVSMETLTSFDPTIIFNNHNHGGHFQAAHTINNETSSALISQFEKMMSNKSKLRRICWLPIKKSSFAGQWALPNTKMGWTTSAKSSICSS